MSLRRCLVLVALLSASACSSSNASSTNSALEPDAQSSFDVGAPPSDPLDAAMHLDAATNDDAPKGPTSTTLTATIRDFKVFDAADPKTNPDFENVPKGDPIYGPWDDHGIVEKALGADGKPVYASATTTVTTHGKAWFDQWYHDTDGMNLVVHYPIALTKNADGSYGYDSEASGVPLSSSDPTKMFFPIDDGTPYATAFGNQGMPHNYSFTVELHTTFVYKGGEFFRFRGDDDVFVFVDGSQVIDLGGIHGPETATVNVDDLGLTKGTQYTLDFFSAERHVVGSNILFTTTLDLQPVPIR